MVVGRPTIANVAMALANTEYSYALPTGTRRLMIQLRDPGYPFQLAVDAGASGTTYYNIARDDTLKIEDIKGQGITLYFRSTTNDMVAEIESWA